MRKEKEVLAQLLDFAASEDRVRAVIFNGSRVNPNIEKDIFCDYDVVFSATEPEYYLGNQGWIQRFGELVIMQQNDCKIGEKDKYIFLMQFKDGVRIDLSFDPIECIAQTIASDSLTEVLLDKDKIIKPLPPPVDSMHYVSKPTEIEFNKVMNEAWWIQTYVAKGILRDEYPLVRYMYDVILQECIIKLLSWYVGLHYDWNINIGKCGRWLKKYLPEPLFNEFKAAYSGGGYEQIWAALFNVGDLIRKVGTDVAQRLGYKYPLQDDINVTEYIKRVKASKKDATEFN
ncbi:MAG: aminoglycoside 6-adenylyltransferase [Ruminiclostridium sp.]|nr:aminoglycoside 6-adenylyltransferase [Ruminiclostridium sp.]